MMAGRSSTRHKREIYGYDSAGETAAGRGATITPGSGQWDEYNDYTAKGVEPSSVDATSEPEEPDNGGDTGGAGTTDTSCEEAPTTGDKAQTTVRKRRNGKKKNGNGEG